MVPEYVDSRNGARPPGDEMRIDGQPQDCEGDGLDPSVRRSSPYERANRTELAMSAIGTKRTCQLYVPMSAFGGKADILSQCPLMTQSGQERRTLASAQNKRLRQSQSDAASCVFGAAMVRGRGLIMPEPPPGITQTSAPRLTSQCALYEQSNRNMQSRELRGQGVRMPFPQAMPQGRARA